MAVAVGTTVSLARKHRPARVAASAKRVCQEEYHLLEELLRVWDGAPMHAPCMIEESQDLTLRGPVDLAHPKEELHLEHAPPVRLVDLI